MCKKSVFAIVLLLSLAAIPTAVFGDSLVGHWTMDDDAANTTVADSTADNYHGTFVDPTNPNTSYHHSTDCQEGTGSLYFDGTDDYVTMPRASVLETGDASTHQLSTSVWIKSDYTSAPTDFTSIVGTGDGGWFLGSFPNNDELVFVCWLLNGASGETAVVTDNTAVFDGDWHNATGVFDGISIHLYVDGNHGENSTIGGSIRNINNKGIHISENAGATGRYWDGLIDDVKIYDYDPCSEPGDPCSGDWSITFPVATWESKTAAELNLDDAKLNQFVSNVGGVGCIVRQGYMVKTWGTQSSKDYWASASKPVTSTMLFYAVEEGLLTDVHELIEDHGWALIPKDDPMEFYHLANMTSGYARGEVPGTAWAYNDYGIKLYMETLFGNVYGTTANAACTHPDRLGALNFQDGSIFQTLGGNGEHLNTTPRDFARIGWFWCNKGFWNGSQLLPKHYFDEYMQTHVSGSTPRTTTSGSDYLGVGTYGGGSDQTQYGPGIYGFNWWFNPSQSNWPDAPEDTVQANGHWGAEVMTVIPSLSLVVACRGNNGSFEPGNPSSSMNQNLKLLTEACPPVPTGSLVVDQYHPAWLKYYNEGPLFMCGPGDPEEFLYRGTRNGDGTRSGDQMTLINKLIGTGANCIYFQAVKTHGGDGDSTMNPFIDSNINNLLDEDILDQWETWFTAMDDNDIVIFFMFYDDNSGPFGSGLVGGELPAQEAYMIDTIVNRFEHHKHLIWIVSEEYQKALTAARVSKIAERIKMADDYDHPVGTHQLPSTSFDFNGDDNMDQFAMQLNDATTSYVHSSCVAAWNNVGGLKNVNLAEIYEFNTIPQTGAALRQKAWAAAMGGAYSMWLWMDIASTPVSDLEICGRVVEFMESTRFYETQPYDSLARGSTDYVLAYPGNVYIVYGDSGTSLGVNVQAGTYNVKWFDTIDGDWSDQGSQTLSAGDQYFTKPGGIGTEAVVYLDNSTAQSLVAPVIVNVSPDPDTNVYAGSEYTKQLQLQQGDSPISWSVVQSPTGTQVNSSGYVYGWIPGGCDVGSSITIEIRAQNSGGSDTETWQVEPEDYYLEDGVLDFNDLAVMADEWLETGSSLATDLDCSSDVDFLDYAILADEYGSGEEPPPPDLVISSLSSGSGRSYQVVYDGLNVGAIEFTDRAYTFSGVPSAYQGKTYIKTPNDDRGSTGDSFVTFDINRSATVYVAHDDRIGTKPTWMSSFTDTGDHLTSSDNSNTFSLYSKVFTAGTVTLGGNYGDGTVSMYSIVVIEQ